MGDSLLFQFGLFVVIIFVSGILFTIREFSQMDEEKQREWKRRKEDVHVKDNRDS